MSSHRDNYQRSVQAGTWTRVSQVEVLQLRDALCSQKGIIRITREHSVWKNGYKHECSDKKGEWVGWCGANPRQLVVRSNTLARPILTLIVLLFPCHYFLLFLPETIKIGFALDVFRKSTRHDLIWSFDINRRIWDVLIDFFHKTQEIYFATLQDKWQVSRYEIWKLKGIKVELLVSDINGWRIIIFLEIKILPECMNVSLLFSNHRHVSASHVTIFRVARTRYRHNYDESESIHK